MKEVSLHSHIGMRLGIGTLLWIAALSAGGCSNVEGDWTAAQQANTKDAYSQFLEQYPNGEYSDEAFQAIEALDWATAQQLNTADAYLQFLEQYPAGARSDEASQAVEALAWDAATKAGTLAALETYVRDYPDSRYASEAESRIEELNVASPLCPPPAVSGPGMFAGSENSPVPVVNGRVSQLDGVGPPIRFSSTHRQVVLSNVYYRGSVSGPYILPTAGVIGAIRIGDKELAIDNGDISSGCLQTRDVGQVLVLFENSLLSESVTLVMTQEQIRRLE